MMPYFSELVPFYQKELTNLNFHFLIENEAVERLLK
jgi:hypothetical protein